MIAVKSPSIAAVPSDPPKMGDQARATASFEEIYDQHVDFVWRGARRLGVDDASVDDVIQQVFLVVHRRLAEFEGRSSVKTWLFSILLHAVRGHKRTVRRKSPHTFQPPSDPDALVEAGVAENPELALERAEASRTIDLLLETLDEDKRVVFVMAELEQLTAGEISEATGLEPKAVYSRLRAARTDFERAAAQLRRRALAGRTP